MANSFKSKWTRAASSSRGGALSKKEVERARATLDKQLADAQCKALSEKAKLDIATLEAVRAVKH